MSNLTYVYSDPMSGIPCFFLMLMIYFGQVSTRPLPDALVIALFGTALYWINPPDHANEYIIEGAEDVKWWGLNPNTGSSFESFKYLNPYWGIIIPVAIANAAQTLINWRVGLKNGDEFPLRESMIADGLGSFVGGLLGSPFGTTMYIGHGAYKKVGARSSYSVMNGLVYIIFSFTGLFSLLSAIVPLAAIGPIICFVGLMIFGDAVQTVPLRHIPAVTVSIIPPLIEWALTQTHCASGSSPQHNNEGLSGLAGGSLIISLVITAMFVYIIDSKYWEAAAWTVIAALASIFGLMHFTELSVDFDWENRAGPARVTIGYAVVFLMLLIVAILQTFEQQKIVPPRLVSNAVNSMTIGDLHLFADKMMSAEASKDNSEVVF